MCSKGYAQRLSAFLSRLLSFLNEMQKVVCRGLCGSERVFSQVYHNVGRIKFELMVGERQQAGLIELWPDRIRSPNSLGRSRLFAQDKARASSIAKMGKVTHAFDWIMLVQSQIDDVLHAKK